jgi:hypothetical protein
MITSMTPLLGKIPVVLRKNDKPNINRLRNKFENAFQTKNFCFEIQSDFESALEINSVRSCVSSFYYNPKNVDNNIDLRKNVIQYFQNLNDKLPLNCQGQASFCVKKIFHAAILCVNEFASENQNQYMQEYNDAVNDFYNLVSSHYNESEHQLSLLKDIIFLSGLLTAYEPRTCSDKISVWIKRLFAPVSYLVHQLSGVFVERQISDLIFASMPYYIAYGVSILLTFALGFETVELLHIISECGLEVSEKRNEKKLALLRDQLKCNLEADVEPIEEISLKLQYESNFCTNVTQVFCKKISENLLFILKGILFGVSLIIPRKCSTPSKEQYVTFAKLLCFFSFDTLNDVISFVISNKADNSDISDEWKDGISFVGPFIVGIPITLVGCICYFTLCNYLDKKYPKAAV